MLTQGSKSGMHAQGNAQNNALSSPIQSQPPPQDLGIIDDPKEKYRNQVVSLDDIMQVLGTAKSMYDSTVMKDTIPSAIDDMVDVDDKNSIRQFV